MGELLWWHRVGQVVVCVDDSPVKNPAHPPLILKAEYTIAEVWAEEVCRPVCIGFAEHPFPGVTNGGGRCFLWEATRFRPVKTTSIDQFRELLNPTPERRNVFEGMPEVEHV